MDYQTLEVIRPRDEIRFAVHFHQHADLSTHVDVAADQSFVRRPAGFLCRLRQSALAKNRGGFFEITLGLREGSLAFHHSRAGGIAEFLHEGGVNLWHLLSLRHGSISECHFGVVSYQVAVSSSSGDWRIGNWELYKKTPAHRSGRRRL